MTGCGARPGDHAGVTTIGSRVQPRSVLFKSGVGLDEAVDWREVEAFVRRSYGLVAPKRLAKLVA